MANLAGDISVVVYRRTVSGLKDRISLSGKMLEVLLALDGSANLLEISHKINASISDIRPAIIKLLEHELIEEVPESVVILEPKFFSFLITQLSIITGPIAKVIVEDALVEIGGESTVVPFSRAAELVALIGGEIPDDDQRREFVQSALNKLKEL